jgi:hypothetical protein
MNLGHAFRLAPGSRVDLEVEAAVDVVNGTIPLTARTPIESDAVQRAERVLGVKGPVVYAFAGCLHPKLGTIGLIINARCATTSLEGSTRCDSGGLAGRYGGFEHIADEDVDETLVLLSFLGSNADAWRPSFADELTRSYSAPQEYVAGSVPTIDNWTDARAACLNAHDPSKGPPDRRLWTWEVRLADAPKVDDFVAIAFSPEAFKYVEALRVTGKEIPDHVRLVVGDVSRAGVHYFSDSRIHEILCTRYK